jgi:hypothetical protein
MLEGLEAQFFEVEQSELWHEVHKQNVVEEWL